MSKSTPADLAVAFRSMLRRRTEALDAAEGAPVQGLLADLDAHIGAAAAVLASESSAAAVAAAIEARSTEDWDEATLDVLREHATAAGTVLRRIAAAPGAD